MAPGRPTEYPFKHNGSQSSSASVTASSKPAEPSARCPFNHSSAEPSAQTGAGDVKLSSSAAAVAQDVSPPGRCPFSGAAVNSKAVPAGSQPVPPEEVLGQPNQQSEKGPPATCPYGFGSSKSSSKPLHCPACSALFHDAVRLNCGHKLCQACAAPCQDCLLCGEDITSRETDAELQGNVDEYMRAAGVCSQPGQAQEAAERVGGMDLKAAFWLQEGMRSLAGGNPVAALHRLQVCHEHLEQLASEAARKGPNASEAVQLASVRGTCGDCCLQLRMPEAAAGHYEASTSHLTSCTESSPEVLQALAVSHSKLGDLHYQYGHLEPALACYQAALQIRREAASSPVTQDTVAQHLSLATSLVKLADLEQACGRQAAAAATAHEAETTLAQLTSKCQPSAALQAKIDRLQTVLADVTRGTASNS